MAGTARTVDTSAKMAGTARKRKRRAEDTRERERLARDIERTSESIREKRRALKTGMIEEDIALERRFKPIVEPLKQIAEESRPIDRETANVARATVKREVKKKKREDSDNGDGDGDGDDDSYWLDDGWLRLASRKDPRVKRLNVTLDSPTVFDSTPMEPLPPPPPPPPLTRNKRETSEPSLEASLAQALQTREDRKKLHGQLGPLGRTYMGLLLGDDRDKAVDKAYGVYFDDNGTMLGNKKFDVDKDDSIIVDKVRYVGTPGLFELIFKNHPNDDVFNDDDLLKYGSILSTTNAHRHGYRADGRVRSNKGHKYMNIIRSLVAANKKGTGVIPSAMRLTDNKIDYVHWDDPDELVDRLRLLDASHRAGNNAHDNEILSIVEELREAGFIIN